MGFVLASYKLHAPRDIDSCMLHPSVYNMLIQRVKRSQHLFGRGLHPQIPWPFDPVSARLCSSMEDKGHPKEFMHEQYDNIKSFHLGGLRICINLDHSVLKVEGKRFCEMRNIPVMHLGRWQSSAKHHIEVETTEVLDWLTKFKELKFLSLRGISRITSLQFVLDSFTKLKILDIRACHNLEVLPIFIGLLDNLTYLDASECYLLRYIPKTLIFLSELKVLKGFVPSSWRIPYACHLGDLAYLKNLRKLTINIGRNSIITKGEFIALGELDWLVSLTISWDPESKDSSVNSHERKASASDFVPPPNLRKLDLRCFPECITPERLSPDRLPSLERLYIRGGELSMQSLLRLNMYSAAGPTVEAFWPQVKILRLRYLKRLDLEESIVRVGFPSLDCLEIYRCNKPRNVTSICQLS